MGLLCIDDSQSGRRREGVREGGGRGGEGKKHRWISVRRN